MNTQTISTTSIPADLLALTAYMRESDLYKMQMENVDLITAQSEATIEGTVAVSKALLETFDDEPVTVQENLTYLAAVTGLTSMTAYGDGEHAVLIIKELDTYNSDKLIEAFREDKELGLILEDENGIVKTTTGVYNTNDYTITIATPYAMAETQIKTNNAIFKLVTDWLEERPEFKAAVEAHKAKFM